MRERTKSDALQRSLGDRLATPSGSLATPFDAARGLSAKRLFDVAAAAAALLSLVVVFALVAVWIKASDRGPVFFRHPRIGRGGRRFDCLKFRTMRIDGDAVLEAHFAAHPWARAEWAASQKLRHDPRVTAVGRVLRASSIDELPQLINILRGDMSVVGPRPIVQAEMPRYGNRIGAYLSVRPGLTGLWQVSGRSDVDYDRRVALDCDYVARRSLSLDLVIILRTLPVVLAARGAR